MTSHLTVISGTGAAGTGAAAGQGHSAPTLLGAFAQLLDSLQPAGSGATAVARASGFTVPATASPATATPKAASSLVSALAVPAASVAPAAASPQGAALMTRATGFAPLSAASGIDVLPAAVGGATPQVSTSPEANDGAPTPAIVPPAAAATLAGAADALPTGVAGNDGAAAPPAADPAGTADAPGEGSGATGAAAASAPTSPAAGESASGPALLKNLAAALHQLDGDEQNGGTPGKATLKRVKDAIAALATYLAGQGMTVPAPVAATAGTNGSASAAAAIAPAGASASSAPGAAASATLAAPAATAGAGTTPEPASPDDAAGGASGPDGSIAAAATAEVKPGADAGNAAASAGLARLDTSLQALSTAPQTPTALGAAMERMAQLLDPKTLSPRIAGQLGLGSDTAAADPDVTAAIRSLASPSAQMATQPRLATAQLDLPGGASAGTSAPGFAAASAGTVAPISKSPDRPAGSAATPAGAAPVAPTAAQAATADTPHDAGKKPVDTTAIGKAEAAPAAPVTPSVPAAGEAPPPLTSAAATPSSGALQAQAAYQPAAGAAVNLPQMAFDIVRHAQQGASHFQIRLDPGDLGRVDVKLAIDGSGAVTAHLTAERPDTLDLLKRDSGALGQALSQAGLDAGRTNLQFSLSQNPFGRQDASTYAPQPSASGAAGAAADEPAGPAVATTYYRATASIGGVNLFV